MHPQWFGWTGNTDPLDVLGRAEIQDSSRDGDIIELNWLDKNLFGSIHK